MKETEQTLLGQIPKEEKKEPFVKAIIKLESENKALREENTKCKELSWEAANEISRLKKEIERLEWRCL